MKLDIPYFRGHMTIEVPDNRIKAILTPMGQKTSVLTEIDIVKEALNNPIQSDTLANLAHGKNNILIITSDHTRPLPSRITMPLLLEHIRSGNPAAKIKILIATGFHRATTLDELNEKFGEELVNSEEFIVHDAFDDSAMVSKGALPSGGELKINRLVDWVDLIVAEGFIEPHFFAGFSGGRKSILPGICSKDTIMYNHYAQFIAHPRARTGMLEGNPMQIDMNYAAELVGLDFILNVSLDENKRINAAFAGHFDAAHRHGCDSVRQSNSLTAVKSDLVVTSNGGYPLDQNIYQTVKGLTAGESCINPGGVIIIVSSCINGHGGEGFYRLFVESGSPEEVANKINAIPPEETLPDQWEAQILARILTICSQVIIVSQHADPNLIKAMSMSHASTFEEALQMADHHLGYQAEMVIIPNGVSVIFSD